MFLLWWQSSNLKLFVYYRLHTTKRTACLSLFANCLLCHSFRLSIIQETFQRLDEEAPEALAPVMDYVYRIWICSSVFEIHHLSDFMTAIGTNCYVEGWHNRLKTGVSTRGPVPFYHFVNVLHMEATDISLNMKLVSEGKLQGTQKKRTRQMEGWMFSLWQQYCERK